MKEKDNRRWYMKEKYSVPVWLYKQWVDLSPDDVLLVSWPFRCGKSYFLACMSIAHFLRKLSKGEVINEDK